MPRKDQGWITFQTSEEERQLLEMICQRSQRTKTEVLREMLRGLKRFTEDDFDEPEISVLQPLSTESEKDNSKETNHQQSGGKHPHDFLVPKKPLKVSSRNILEGKVKQVVKGTIHTEVTVEIVHRVELTSTITTTSAEVLELEEGKTAYAVIKSSDVVIAME